MPRWLWGIIMATALVLSGRGFAADKETSGSLFATWQIITAAIATPTAGVVGLAIWKIWIWFFGRKDDNVHRTKLSDMTYEQQLQAAFLSAGARMDENTKWIIEQLRGSLDEAEERKNMCEQEVARWNEIAQYWYWNFREREHDIRDSRQLALSMSQLLLKSNIITEKDIPSWPPQVKIIALEDPFPKPKGQKDGSDSNHTA